MELTKKFNKFAGKEVMVTEHPEKLEILGETFEFLNPTIDEKDPIIADLKAEAKKAGYNVCIWLPETMGTMEIRSDRLNVHVNKEQDGKYRIQPDFYFG